jgi:hypothetical protein
MGHIIMGSYYFFKRAIYNFTLQFMIYNSLSIFKRKNDIIALK